MPKRLALSTFTVLLLAAVLLDNGECFNMSSKHSDIYCVVYEGVAFCLIRA